MVPKNLIDSVRVFAGLATVLSLLIFQSNLRADPIVDAPNSIIGNYKGELKFRKIIQSSSNPTFEQCPIDPAMRSDSFKVRNLHIFKRPNLGYSYIFPKGALLNNKWRFNVAVEELINGNISKKLIALFPELPHEREKTNISDLNSDSTDCYSLFGVDFRYENAGRSKFPISLYRDYYCAPKKKPHLNVLCFSEKFQGIVRKVK